MKRIYLITIIIFIFILPTAIRYWPIFHKGFSSEIAADNLVLARNLSLVGEYKIDNEKNIILSSEVVKEKGVISTIGNKLTPILYSKIFNLFGFNQGIPLYVSLILYGISSVLLFLLVLKIFNIWVALIFSFVEIFSPLVVKQATMPGFQEWAVFFTAIALFIYLRPQKHKEEIGSQKTAGDYLKLFLSGLFFSLASLARNSFLFLPFAFLVYDFWRNKSFKRAIMFILPVLIFWGIYLGPNFIENRTINNHYLSSQERTNAYLHLFPDSYTWHFERDSYVKSVSGTTNYDYTQFLIKYGYPVSLKNKVLMYWSSIKSYPSGLFAQTTIGGPFLVFFLIVGGGYLYRKKKELLGLFILWAVILYLSLVILQSNHWGHFIALQLPIFLLISLGIYWFIQFILKQDFKAYFKYLLIFGFIVTLFLHLIQSDKWAFHENYLYSKTEEVFTLIDFLKDNTNKIDKKNDVIAIGIYTNAPALVNYYTDFSCIYFDPATVKKLLKENKLQWAFDQFGITKVIGYDKELTDEIIKVTNAKTI